MIQQAEQQQQAVQWDDIADELDITSEQFNEESEYWGWRSNDKRRVYTINTKEVVADMTDADELPVRFKSFAFRDDTAVEFLLLLTGVQWVQCKRGIELHATYSVEQI